jgi:hypothetical protein
MGNIHSSRQNPKANSVQSMPAANAKRLDYFTSIETANYNDREASSAAGIRANALKMPVTPQQHDHKQM